MSIRRRFIFIGITLILLGYALYGHTLQSPFHQDDEAVIVYNAAIKHLDQPVQLFNEFNTRFLVGLSLAVDYAYGGLRYSGYHLFNVMVHMANAFLVFYLCFLLSKISTRLQGITKNELFLCWFVSLAFFVHPIQTQAVNTIWQRSTLMCAFFIFLACICYIRYIKLKQSLSLVVCLLASIGAFFSREVAVILPVLLLMIESCFSRPNEKLPRKRWIALVANFLLVVMIAALFIRPDRTASEFFISPNLVASPDAPFWEKLFRWTPSAQLGHKEFILSQLVIFWRYIWLLLMPIGLNVDHSVVLRDSMADPAVFLSLMGIVLFAVLIYAFAREYKVLFFGSMWFIATLLLMMLLPNQEMMAEHWLYIPLFGFYLSVGCAILLFTKRTRSRLMLMLFLLGFWSVLTWQRNDLWGSQIKLWEDAVQKSPQKVRPYENLTVAYINEKNFDAALPAALKAKELSSDRFMIYNHLGIIYTAQGKYDLAHVALYDGLEIKPENIILNNNLAALLIAEGKLDAAERILLKIMQKDHGYPNVYFNLGNLYKKQGRLKEAEEIHKRLIGQF